MRARPKIVLFHPRVALPHLHRMPWSVLVLAGNIDRTRFDVVIVDGGKEPDPIRALFDACEGALCCGISCFTGNQTVNALKAARALRRRHPALPLIWGGAHPSMYVKETIEDVNVDIVVRGQGESAFAQVCEAIAAGAEPANIPGVTYKTKKADVIFGNKEKMGDQNSFGRPPFEMLDPSKYLVHIMVGGRAITYHSSTGCPFPCQFCTVNFEFEMGWSAYSAERVVEELKDLLKLAPETDSIEFSDSNLIVNTKRVEKLCQGMIEANIVRPWIAFGRPDQLAKMSNEHYALMAKSGCKRFFVGIESGDPRMLTKVQKEHTNEQVFTMAEKMRAHGISADLSFTLGYPEDPVRDVKMSLDLARDLKKILPSAVFVLNTYTPYESTPLFSDAVAHGLKPTETLSDWEAKEWRNFGFRKSVTPWMTADIDRSIRDFETVASSAFIVEEDIYKHFGVKTIHGQWIKKAMIALAKKRFLSDRTDQPYDVLALRKLFFALNPRLGDSGPPLVDGHQAGIK